MFATLIMTGSVNSRLVSMLCLACRDICLISIDMNINGIRLPLLTSPTPNIRLPFFSADAVDAADYPARS